MIKDDEVPLAKGWTDELLFEFVATQADFYAKITKQNDDPRWVAGFGSAMYWVATLIPKSVFDACALDPLERYEKK